MGKKNAPQQAQFIFPKTQGELVRFARGQETQASFAARLRVDRSCLSRYERGELGAPTAVIDHCLQEVARALAKTGEPADPIGKALALTRQAVEELQSLSSVAD